MGKGKPKTIKKKFLMEHWGVSSLDELAEKLSKEPLQETYQENDNINHAEIELFVQLDAEDPDYLIEKSTSISKNKTKVEQI